MKKRLLAWILAVMLVLTLLPAAVLAEDGANAAKSVEVSTLSMLQDALDAAADAGSGNTTIDLKANITLGTGDTWTPVYVDGYDGAGVVTLNGNGHTITGLNAPLFKGGFAGVSGIVINDLTLKNVNLSDTGSEYGSTGFGAFICAVDSMQTIKLKNCHVDGGSIVSKSGARVGGLIGWTSGYNKTNDGPVDTAVAIENCSVKNLTIEANGSVGGLIGHAGANPATYHTLTDCKVENCTLKSTKNNSSSNSNYVGTLIGTANVGQVTLATCTASGNKLKQNSSASETLSDEILHGRAVVGTTGLVVADNTVVAAAEMYGVKAGNTVPDTLIKNANGKWEVLRESTVAMIGTAQYASLAEAITAAQNGETIKLLKDVTENVTIPAGIDLTLDLNGKTLSGGTTAGKPALLNNGTVTIKDSSEAQTGKICREDNGRPGYYTIDNQGTMTIESGSVYNNTGTMPRGSSLIRNAGLKTAATLIINGGDIKQDGFIAVKNDDHGILIINGGAITTTGDTDTNTASAVQNWAQATINGGTINGTIWTSVWDNNLPSSVTTIKNAKVTGKIIVKPDSSGLTVIPTLKIEGGDFTVTGWDVQDNGVVSISGGTFNVDPTDYLADGYIVKKLDDGTWGVSEKEPEFPSWISALPALEGSKKLPFTDVWRGDWYYDGVRYVYDNDLMNGTSGTEFSPNAATTRGMIVTILARMDGVNTSGTPWYEAGREWAMWNDISDGTNMEGKITREQLAAMLTRYAALKNRDVSAIASISAYADASNVSNWAVDAMRWAVGEGLIQGSNNHLRPQSNATRAEVATILMRFCKLLKK